MLAFAEALEIIANRLEAVVPGPDGNGDHVFELADDMLLGLRPLAADSGLVGWAAINEARPGEPREETEKLAAEILRIHLARLRHAGETAPTRDDSGAFILYLRMRPDSERSLLDSVAKLLNEAEAMRRVLPGGGRTATGDSLFSGMTGMFGRP